MKVLLIVLSLFAIVQYMPAQNKMPVRIDTLAERLGKDFMKQEGTVGLSIGVYQNGEKHFFNFGSQVKDKQVPVTSKTIYEIGSITKTFVSLVLANAVVEKKLALNDDVRKYLDGNFPGLEYKGKPITLAHLANTTSRIPNWLPLTPSRITDAPGDSTAFLRESIYGGYSRKDFFNALATVRPDTLPGTKSAHSNAAAQLLTYILENVYKSPINELVEKYVLSPLKMKGTGFLVSGNKNPLLAKGYNVKGQAMPYFTTEFLKGVGGLNSSASDLVQFIEYQLSSGNKAIDLSHQTSFNAGYYQIGLNWLIYKHENGYRQLWTDGGTYGFCSYLVIYPELNSGIVLLANENDDNVPGKLGDIAYQLFLLMGQKH